MGQVTRIGQEKLVQNNVMELEGRNSLDGLGVHGMI
jgi:hypothetical protein